MFFNKLILLDKVYKFKYFIHRNASSYSNSNINRV